MSFLNDTLLSELLSHLKSVHSGLGAGELDLKMQMKTERKKKTQIE